MQAIKRFINTFSDSFRKQGLVGKIVLGSVALFALYCLFSILIAILSPSSSTSIATTTSVSIETAISTETKIALIRTNTAITLPSNTISAPSDTPEPTEVSALFPGLQSSDVIVNLEQHGMTCTSPEQGDLYIVRTCKKETAVYSFIVDVYGRELFSVDLIESTVLQYSNPTNEIAMPFLGFMATMPYDGAVQDEARKWVEDTIPMLKGQGDVRETNFAGVKYRLYGIPTAITLEMGDLP